MDEPDHTAGTAPELLKIIIGQQRGLNNNASHSPFGKRRNVCQKDKRCLTLLAPAVAGVIMRWNKFMWQCSSMITSLITTIFTIIAITHCKNRHGGGGVDPIPCVSTHRISDPRSGPAQLLPPHVKQRSHPHGVHPQIPDR